MDLSVAFLGTGGSVPTARRATASVLVARGGERLLFDCGEGTQRQMQRSLGLVQVDEIYLTHFHADHFLGLPGLLKTYDLTGPRAPLHDLRAAGPARLFATLRRILGRAASSSSWSRSSRAMPSRTTATRCVPSRSSTASRRCGYALVEEDRPGRFDAEAARRLGVPEGPDFGAPAAWRGGRGQRRRREARAGDGGAAAGPDGRDQRRHRALRRRRPRRPRGPSCWSTTPASPRRRPSARPRPATRPPARRPRWPARRR